jgi:hypothetical protein
VNDIQSEPTTPQSESGDTLQPLPPSFNNSTFTFNSIVNDARNGRNGKSIMQRNVHLSFLAHPDLIVDDFLEKLREEFADDDDAGNGDEEADRLMSLLKGT